MNKFCVIVQFMFGMSMILLLSTMTPSCQESNIESDRIMCRHFNENNTTYYFIDKRTNLCFFGRGFSHGSFITHVPCTQEVMKLLVNAEECDK